MRVAVLIVGRGGEQGAGLAQVRADRPVGRVELIVDDAALAAEPQPVLAILAVALDREHRIDAVRLAQLEIILAMVGRHMDQAGAAVGGDELAGQEGRGLAKKPPRWCIGWRFQRSVPASCVKRLDEFLPAMGGGRRLSSIDFSESGKRSKARRRAVGSSERNAKDLCLALAERQFSRGLDSVPDCKRSPG